MKFSGGIPETEVEAGKSVEDGDRDADLSLVHAQGGFPLSVTPTPLLLLLTMSDTKHSLKKGLVTSN